MGLQVLGSHLGLWDTVCVVGRLGLVVVHNVISKYEVSSCCVMYVQTNPYRTRGRTTHQLISP